MTGYHLTAVRQAPDPPAIGRQQTDWLLLTDDERGAVLEYRLGDRERAKLPLRASEFLRRHFPEPKS